MAERQAFEQHIAFEIADAARDRVAARIVQGDRRSGTRRASGSSDQQYLCLDATGRLQGDGQGADFARAKAQPIARARGPEAEIRQQCQLGFHVHRQPGRQTA